MFDGQNCFRDNAESAFEQEIVDADYRPCEGAFHGSQKGVGGAVGNGREGSLKRRAGHGGNSAAEKLDGGGFAESAGFALKGHAHGLAIGRAHRQALSCNKERKTKSKDSLRGGESLPERIGCGDATFSYEANRRPKWLLRPPEAEV